MPRARHFVRTILQPIAIAIVLAFLARAALQIYAIPSPSMAPTLRTGDRIVVTRYFGRKPEAGHVVVFTSPADGREMLVKRIVAVPGDLVDSRFGRLRVGARTLAEPYVSDPAATGEIAAFVVPADSYFVLGDNRRDSLDSRTWGVVPESAIAGRARMILWSSQAPLGSVVLASASPDAATDDGASGGTRLFKWIE